MMDSTDDDVDFLCSFTDESEAFFSKKDISDLDHAIALSLQEKQGAVIERKSEAFFNKIDEDYNYAFALSLEGLFDETKEKPSLPKPTSTPISIVDDQWEVLDPTPDIHALFLQYNVQFFYGKLDGVEVKWSPRMYLCAGVCSYEGRGGLCSVRLSLPLLKLRPRRDLVQTLLHEMIHAYLFVTANNKDHDAHGPEFLKHMHRINKETGSKITVYHSFHDEVNVYRKHIWKCNGVCQKRSPYFGYVRRAINRAPGPKDFWWAQHQTYCGGTFTKHSEPEGYKKKGTKIGKSEPVKRKPLLDKSPNIKKFLKTSTSTVDSKDLKDPLHLKEGKSINTLHSSSVPDFSHKDKNNVTAFTGQGFSLGSSSSAVPKTFLAKIRRELPSSSTAASNTSHVNESRQKTSSRLKDSTHTLSNKTKNIQKESCVLGALNSSKDSVKIKGKPLNNRASPKTVSNKSKKPGFVQNSMDMYVASTSKPVVNDSFSIPPKVACPVCMKMFTSSEINAHVDFCLSWN